MHSALIKMSLKFGLSIAIKSNPKQAWAWLNLLPASESSILNSGEFITESGINTAGIP